MTYNLNILQYIIVILNTKDASEYLGTLTIHSLKICWYFLNSTNLS